MTVHTRTYLGWLRYPQSRLVLLAGDREVTVPHPVAATLRAFVPHLTSDPAHDLLLAEHTIRHQAAGQAAAVAQAADRVAAAEKRVTRASQLQLPARVRETWAAKTQVQQETTAHNVAVRAHQVLTERLHALRRWVVDVDMSDGWLGEAAAGWRRDPACPPWVQVFADEDVFIDGDERRGIAADWGATVLGGVQVGTEWRRDGDDEDPAVEGLLRTGTWWLTYLPVTGEICASRHNTHSSRQVWLLGRHFDPDRSHVLLTGLEGRMREPNSLILAAHVVHQHDTPREVDQ